MNRQKKSGAFSQSRTGAALTRFSLFFEPDKPIPHMKSVEYFDSLTPKIVK